MDILVFDMDGVLVRPVGYHRALQDTVRLAGNSSGIGPVALKKDQVTRFEALGISSEWHSTALCMAAMVLEKQTGWTGLFWQSNSDQLMLDSLFEALADQPVHVSALHRGVAAIESLAEKYAVPADPSRNLIANSESIDLSPTLNWFQEMVLGSRSYAEIYQKKSQLQVESYLQHHDKALLSDLYAEKLKRWAAEPGNAAVIMTSRPSQGPSGFFGMPDAELGALLVGLNDLPLVGKGELIWLAHTTGIAVELIQKPSWKHSLAALLAACGKKLENHQRYFNAVPAGSGLPGLQILHNSTITVFEDTPGGIISMQETANLLGDQGIRVRVEKIGIAAEPAKKAALLEQDARVYADINQALASLDDF
jgi:hypothetical protein